MKSLSNRRCKENAESMSAELGAAFSLIQEAAETHSTPWDTPGVLLRGVPSAMMRFLALAYWVG